MQATLERLRERREQRGDEGGFTLIELLIVIVILGILAAIVVFAVQNLTGTSVKASCSSDYKTVETGVESYKAQMGNYPSGTGGSLPATDTATGGNAAGPSGQLLTGSLVGGGNDANGNATSNIASPSGSPVGPWLKDVPANGTHYTISVANDGTGTISVAPAGVTGNPCANVT